MALQVRLAPSDRPWLPLIPFSPIAQGKLTNVQLQSLETLLYKAVFTTQTRLK